ncbi:MAG TPA: type II toxin-antitoxin system YafQ family toxin [Clostridia bacterium]|nr:type II toxin-antitoxin system YafQ family toxin [Clostridia bacterium]
MRTVNYSNQFKRDVKLVSKRCYKLSSLNTVMKALENEEVLDAKYKEHHLSGNYNGYLECHIDPDWLLIYKINGQDLYFVRTGTHSDLF